MTNVLKSMFVYADSDVNNSDNVVFADNDIDDNDNHSRKMLHCFFYSTREWLSSFTLVLSVLANPRKKLQIECDRQA